MDITIITRLYQATPADGDAARSGMGALIFNLIAEFEKGLSLKIKASNNHNGVQSALR